MDLQIEYVDKRELKPYANNAKIHTAEQIEQIKASIAEFGMNDPIAVWHDNEVVEGHGRLLALMEMDEITQVPIIRLDELTDEQRRAYMLAHNKLTMNTDFDVNLLDIELDDITDIDMSLFGFDLSDISEEDQAEIIEDEVPEPPKEPKTVLGDIYELGGVHRVICGDSTDVNVIDRLMDGVKADCVFTDPPYNVAIGSKNAVLNEMSPESVGIRPHGSHNIRMLRSIIHGIEKVADELLIFLRNLTVRNRIRVHSLSRCSCSRN